MKNIFLLSSILLVLVSCNKDEEQGFVFEPNLTKNVLIEMDTFSGGAYTINDFSLDAKSAAEQALLNSDFENYSSFEISKLEMKSISITNVVSAYSALDEIDSVAFFANGSQVFKLENSFAGGMSPSFYSSNLFNFNNVFNPEISSGAGEQFNLSLLPKTSATIARNQYSLSFTYVLHIAGTYIED